MRDGRLRHRGAAVDTVDRCTNADIIDSEVGELLHPVQVAGALDVLNCFGTGIADDKLAHAYVPAMIRFYLAEDPVLEQVETFHLGAPETLERALDVFDELVIKDREGRRGAGRVHRPAAGRPVDAPDRGGPSTGAHGTSTCDPPS